MNKYELDWPETKRESERPRETGPDTAKVKNNENTVTLFG